MANVETERNRPSSVSRFARARSAVTNGKRLFVDPEGNGRSPWSRRWIDLIAMHLDDIGGLDTASAAQYALSQRAATFQIELEAMEARLSIGDQVDMQLYGIMSGHLRRILETLACGSIGKREHRRDGPHALGVIAHQIEGEWPSASLPSGQNGDRK